MPTSISAVVALDLLLVASACGQAFTPISPALPGSDPSSAKLDGQKLVAESARRVFDEPAIAADLRYRVDAFGHELIGTGRYLQLGAGAEKLLRLELKMQVADKPATLQEICGREYYWVRRDVPPALPTLGRVNLQQIRQSLARTGLDQPQTILPADSWIMFGGLPRLLASLEKNFAFGRPQAKNLDFTGEGNKVQQLPIWVVEGDWKPDRLTAVTGQISEQQKHLPEQVPNRVRVILGRTTDVLPLFPYRITYLKLPETKDAASPTSKPTPPHELLTLELFNVHRKADIDRREFDYQPASQELPVQDLTTAYLQRYGTTQR